MAATSTQDATLALVHEGWNHLMSQRPLAAWGTWQRALAARSRFDRGPTSARDAGSGARPSPGGPPGLSLSEAGDRSEAVRWDQVFRNGQAAELADAAEAFGRLAAETPDDAEAWFNRALCLAWPGWTARRSSGWMRSPDWSPTATRRRPWKPGPWPRSSARPGVRKASPTTCGMPAPSPGAPSGPSRCGRRFPKSGRFPRPRSHSARASPADIEVLEWLDRPFPAAERSRASATCRACWPRFTSRQDNPASSPRVETLELAEEKLRRMLGAEAGRSSGSPPPAPPLPRRRCLDHPAARRTRSRSRPQLAREALESYYENQWIHRPRQGLDGLSPLAAAQDAGEAMPSPG